MLDADATSFRFHAAISCFRCRHYYYGAARCAFHTLPMLLLLLPLMPYCCHFYFFDDAILFSLALAFSLISPPPLRCCHGCRDTLSITVDATLSLPDTLMLSSRRLIFISPITPLLHFRRFRYAIHAAARYAIHVCHHYVIYFAARLMLLPLISRCCVQLLAIFRRFRFSIIFEMNVTTRRRHIAAIVAYGITPFSLRCLRVAFRYFTFSPAFRR